MALEVAEDALVTSYYLWADANPARVEEQRYPACLEPVVGERLYRWWKRVRPRAGEVKRG